MEIIKIGMVKKNQKVENKVILYKQIDNPKKKTKEFKIELVLVDKNLNL
jgi:hypothetical protein